MTSHKNIVYSAIIGTMVLVPLSLSARSFGEERLMCAREHKEKKGGLLEQLQLTPQQQEILMKRRKEQKDARQQMSRQIREKRAALHEEIGKPQSDMTKIEYLTQDIKKLQGQQLDERVDELMELKRVLTPQQYQKLQEKVNEAKSQRRRHE